MTSFFYLMSVYREIQKRAQSEIDIAGIGFQQSTIEHRWSTSRHLSRRSSGGRPLLLLVSLLTGVVFLLQHIFNDTKLLHQRPTPSCNRRRYLRELCDPEEHHRHSKYLVRVYLSLHVQNEIFLTVVVGLSCTTTTFILTLQSSTQIDTLARHHKRIL